MVVGDGPYLAEMRRLLPDAIFTGRLTGQELLEAYADGDLFVFPSHTDTLGNVVLEAMSSGMPAVVTDSMGPKELVVNGDTGFVASTDDEFAAAVERLLGDHALRHKMGEAARCFAERRSWESIFVRLSAYYSEVLAAAAVSPALRAV
jgi:glycosyltransferase involved in cell wall biosynthesis